MTEIDTQIGNKPISERLRGLLVNLINSTKGTVELICIIREQARSEGFNDFETDMLIRLALRKVLTDKQIRNLFYYEENKQKKQLVDQSESRPNYDNNLPELPAPDCKVVVSDEVLKEKTKAPRQEFESYNDSYAIEDLRAQLENTKADLEKEKSLRKESEEKYKQLELKTKVSPSNSVPIKQGNNTRTQVVVSQVFREILQLKGSKYIYAYIVIDANQNKYIRLEPSPNPVIDQQTRREDCNGSKLIRSSLKLDL